MPTSAATGTKSVSTAGHKPKSKSAEVPVDPTVSQNGTIQVVLHDGSIVGVDGSQPDWKDQVRKLDPKHPALKYG